MPVSKSIPLKIMKSELEEYAKVMEVSDQESAFVAKYIADHAGEHTLTSGDVHSLLLNAAILLRYYVVCRHILGKDHQDNILTTIDRDNFSPITTALRSCDTTIIDMVGVYTQRVLFQNQVTDLVGEDINHVLTILRNPPCEMSEVTCTKVFLLPLYTRESLDAHLPDHIKDNMDLVGDACLFA